MRVVCVAACLLSLNAAAGFSHCVDRLAARLKQLEGGARVAAQRQMRDAVTGFVAARLNSGDAGANGLAAELRRAIRGGLSLSWAEEPAFAFECPAGVVVAFTLDRAAAGAITAIQLWRSGRGSFVLADEGGSEMNGCNMHLLRTPGAREERFFAYGNIFGANQAISRGVLYAVRDGRLAVVWRMKRCLGLSAREAGGRLVLEYRDPGRFYKGVLPDSFREVYAHAADGVRLIGRTPLPP